MQSRTRRAPRGLAVSALIAATITCANPISPTREAELERLATSDGEVSPAAVSSIVVVLADSQVTVGDTTTATTVVRNEVGRIIGGGNGHLVWTSTNTSVATVANGVVIAVGVGNTIIRASAQGVIGSAPLTVMAPPPPPVASVTVSLAASSILVGQTTTATATVRDVNNNILTDRSVTWSSTNPLAATVDSLGRVTGVSVGIALIVATCEGIIGQASIAVAAPPPPPPPPPPPGFEVPNILNNVSFEAGWDGWVNWSFGTPTGVTRDNSRAFDGSTAIRKALPVTSGSDVGSQFIYPISRVGLFDRVWARYYFYLDAPVNGTVKFSLWFDGPLNTQFGGVYFEGGNLSVFHAPEVAQFTRLRSLSTLTGGWHSIEIDYWRNGDTSNGGQDFPSMAIWLDGQQITSGLGSPAGTARWVNGRLNFGARSSSAKLGVFGLLGLINGSPPNTIPGNVWIDKAALSTLGRIGP